MAQLLLIKTIKMGIPCSRPAPSSRPVMRPVVLPLVFALALLAQHNVVSANIINAKSPAYIDVNSAIALAAEGDTVVIPAGTASWTQSLTLLKGITLKGA